FRGPRDLVESAYVELPPDRGSDDQDLSAFVAEPCKPPADHLANALGETHLVRREPARPAAAFVRDQALLGKVPESLLDEERVPLGLAVDRADEDLGNLGLGERRDQRAYVVFGKPAQKHPLEGALAPERRQHLGERMAV